MLLPEFRGLVFFSLLVSVFNGYIIQWGLVIEVAWAGRRGGCFDMQSRQAAKLTVTTGRGIWCWVLGQSVWDRM